MQASGRIAGPTRESSEAARSEQCCRSSRDRGVKSAGERNARSPLHLVSDEVRVNLQPRRRPKPLGRAAVIWAVRAEPAVAQARDSGILQQEVWLERCRRRLGPDVAVGTAASVLNAILRFEVSGTSLKLFVGGYLVSSVTDSAISGTGGVGMRTIGMASLDNFLAT